MNTLPTLWLPILLGAVVVFAISSLVHMVFKWHASDYNGLANEDAVRDAIRAGNPSPGRYVVPHCTELKDMGSAAMMKKYQEGPVGHFTLAPNRTPNIGANLGQWFLWSVVIAAVAAFMASRLIESGHAHAAAAARLVSAVTFIAHGFGTITESIWMMRPWSSSAKHLLDAALYAIGSYFVFLWLWP